MIRKHDYNRKKNPVITRNTYTQLHQWILPVSGPAEGER